MLHRLADLALRRGRRVVVLAGLFALLAAALGGPVASELGSSRSDFQDPHAQNRRAEQRIERATGGDDRFGLVALVRAGAPVRSSPAARARVRRVADVLRADPAIDRVADYFTTHRVSFLSHDGRSTY